MAHHSWKKVSRSVEDKYLMYAQIANRIRCISAFHVDGELVLINQFHLRSGNEYKKNVKCDVEQLLLLF